MRRALLPAALVGIGLIMFIFGDLTGDHRVRAGGVAIVGVAILMAVAGWLLRRPDEAAQFDLRDWASYVTQSSEPGLLIVRPDQAELYECAVRAFGADRVLYAHLSPGHQRSAIERLVTRQRVSESGQVAASGVTL